MALCRYCGAQVPKGQGRGKQRLYCNDEHQRLAADLRPAKAYALCSVEGCESPANRVAAGLCEKHYTRIRRNGNVFSQYERLPEVIKHTGGYDLIKARGHRLSAGGARAYAHRVAFYEANGEGPFKCHWCAAPVTWADMHVDHLDDNKTNNDPRNLVASCPVCNMQRGHDKVVRTHREKTGLEFRGEKLTLNEWAARIGISRTALVWRLRNGWSVERTLTEGRGVTGPR